MLGKRRECEENDTPLVEEHVPLVTPLDDQVWYGLDTNKKRKTDNGDNGQRSLIKCPFCLQKWPSAAKNIEISGERVGNLKKSVDDMLEMLRKDNPNYVWFTSRQLRKDFCSTHGPCRCVWNANKYAHLDFLHDLCSDVCEESTNPKKGCQCDEVLRHEDKSCSSSSSSSP